LHARAISGFFKGLSKLDNRLYSTERLSEHLIKSYEKGKITFSLRIFSTSFGNFTLNVLFTKLSISVIIFFPEMVLTSNPKSIPLTKESQINL
jgi:hypothetical protein